jgi:hypothetical protein
MAPHTPQDRVARRARLLLAALTLVVLVAAACSSTVSQGPAKPTASAGPTQSPSPSPVPSAATSPMPGASPTASPTPAAVPSPTAQASGHLVSAIQPGNTPNRIPGATNGEMTAGLLVYVDPNCDAYRPAATSLGRLITTAHAEGVSLATEQCYRPLANQTADRNSACTSGNCACAAVGGTSFHGWGEAADFADANGSVNTFTSPTYAWLTEVAARFGWNHPGWAVPNGSPCPEPWHWEWVGDGGSLRGAPIRADVVTFIPTSDGSGYRLVTGLGAVSSHGDAGSGTSAVIPSLNRLIAGGAALPGGNGYWLVGADGGVFAYGNAPYLGSEGAGQAVGSGPTIAGMAATPSGKGYWLVSTSGQVFAFGDAPSLSGPSGSGRFFVGIAADASGKGAWIASSDGQVSALGDAQAFPAASVDKTTDPVMAIAGAPSGQGYWLSTANGSVSGFGDATALGSIPGTPPLPVVSMVATSSGHGYWLATADGNVYAFGDARYLGGG